VRLHSHVLTLAVKHNNQCVAASALLLASLQPKVRNSIVWENAIHAHSTAVAAANPEIADGLLSVVAVVLVAVARLRHLVSVSKGVSQADVGNQNDGNSVSQK